jgi:hypothetical protein
MFKIDVVETASMIADEECEPGLYRIADSTDPNVPYWYMLLTPIVDWDVTVPRVGIWLNGSYKGKAVYPILECFERVPKGLTVNISNE